jgi:hypothetical protein
MTMRAIAAWLPAFVRNTAAKKRRAVNDHPHEITRPEQSVGLEGPLAGRRRAAHAYWTADTLTTGIQWLDEGILPVW